ncbi:hypothetical protein Fmac_001391 [Flemingia macrophylla]|uniref:Uncharacterized protein n=1 Tax=Flemingia macrophylla TaxID=520843 RepID=A0ABD1NH34_9FABA
MSDMATEPLFFRSPAILTVCPAILTILLRTIVRRTCFSGEAHPPFLGLGLGLGIRVRNCLWVVLFYYGLVMGKRLNPRDEGTYSVASHSFIRNIYLNLLGWNLLFWVTICFPVNIALLASSFYQVLILSKLESDYINPFDASSRINYFVLPEFIVQGALCALCLFTGHWFMFLLTVPFICYHLML